MSAAGWRGRRVAVWGAAVSGVAAANLLADLGARVILSDSREDPAVDGLDPRVELRGGGNVLDGAEVLVPSPGIKPKTPALVRAVADGVRLMGEVELAASVAQAPIVAIGGTDGKSTTTMMIGACVAAAGRPVVVAGNIGDPLSARVRDVGPEGVIVAEISAFQVWSCRRFAPRVAVLTNIAEDHADYFGGDFEIYAESKLRLLHDLEPGATAILRAEDPRVGPAWLPPGVRRVAYAAHPMQRGFGVRGGQLTADDRPLMPADALPVAGRHNHANALAALAAGRALGLPMGPMLAALRAFRGLAHRLEVVRTHRGVVWYDDSKATNPHAAGVGLRSLPGPKVVIAGGFEKGVALDPFLAALDGVRHLVVTGQTAARLRAEVGDRLPVWVEPDLLAAVHRAAALAEPGDRVVLSPAASSFDAWRSYAARGEAFAAAVRKLGP